MPSTRGPADTVNVQEKNLRYLCGVINGAGVNTVLAAPGQNQRIVVTSFVVQNETAQAETTIILRDGNNDRWRVNCPNQGNGLSKDFAVGSEWRLGNNNALTIWLSAGNQCGYSLAYFVEHA